MGVSEIVSRLKDLGLSDSEDEDSNGMDPMYTSGMHSYGDDQSNDTTIDNAERYVGSPRCGGSTPTRALLVQGKKYSGGGCKGRERN